MNGLNTRPVRPPLPLFETIGHVCIWVVVVAAAIAIIGYVAWVRFPSTRNTRLIKHLWTACTVFGGGALLGAILMLA